MKIFNNKICFIIQLERHQLGHSLSDVEEEEEEGDENAIYQAGEYIDRKKRAMTKKVSRIKISV